MVGGAALGSITLKALLVATCPAPSSAFSTMLVASVPTETFPLQTPLTKALEEIGVTETELEKATW